MLNKDIPPRPVTCQQTFTADKGTSDLPELIRSNRNGTGQERDTASARSR